MLFPHTKRVFLFTSGWCCRNCRHVFRKPKQPRCDDHHRQGAGTFDRLHVLVDLLHDVLSLHRQTEGQVAESAEQGPEMFHQFGQVGNLARGVQVQQEQVRQRPEGGESYRVCLED